MKRTVQRLKRFFCALSNHGDSETLTISEDAYVIILWKCVDCDTQRWKYEQKREVEPCMKRPQTNVASRQ